MSTPIQYLDKAMTRLRDLGLVPEKTEEAPIVALLNRVADLDEDKVVAIARTLSQASLFNQVVREQVSAMQLSDRYSKITDAFNTTMAAGAVVAVVSATFLYVSGRRARRRAVEGTSERAAADVTGGITT